MGRIVLGRITGPFGVRGWVKVHSHTRPVEGILDYPNWKLGSRTYELKEGRLQGKAIAARLEGVDDRDAAMALAGSEIETERSALPDAGPGEFYWVDLVGCAVKNVAGVSLGEVHSLFNNGAQDVLVVRGEREHLVPFVQGPIVKSVDLEARTIVLDWEADY